MHIDVLIDQYREKGFVTVIISSKEIAFQMNIEFKFCKTRNIFEKK